MSTSENWDRYSRYLIRDESLGFSLDVSRMGFSEGLFSGLSAEIARAWGDLRAVEGGEISNPDEGRQVGHYWLRTPALAPAAEAAWIEQVRAGINDFSAKIHHGEITAPNGNRFRHVLLVGIGGSALGPQLVADALRLPGAPIDLHFLDNTDPAGIDRALADLGDGLAETLVIVTSKSGGTPETRNGMLEVEAAYGKAGLDFPKHAVAITSPTGGGFRSVLHDRAVGAGWLAIFELADWIGGRTSVLSAVGLLPARLIGVDTDAMLAGASEMDALTRVEDARQNPAMLLALMWHHAGGGRGAKDMVVLPYCDRLALFGKYLQQLVMESLGKELDRQGNRVNQGLAVYGNKGSTDQHAYIQQLRDGLNNFFATFVEIRGGRAGESPIVGEGGVTSADYLQGFLRGTRDALSGNGRESITLTFEDLDARSLGALIALFERAVSLYASLVDVNAYHQPGVEAGKKAAGNFLDGVLAVAEVLKKRPGESLDAQGIREALAETLPGFDAESVYHAACHLAASRPEIAMERGAAPARDRFRLVAAAE
jgi:glucose-6-phosphate isomerase